ncbi:hypothetical protein VTO42DRAFT_6165 [Malbranchea cinnamomea]
MAFAVRLDRRLPLLCTRFVRNFHASAYHAHMKAPSTRAKLRELNAQSRVDKLSRLPSAYSMTQAQWDLVVELFHSLPEHVLRSAIKDGLLEVDIVTARDIAQKLFQAVIPLAPNPVPKATLKSIHDDLDTIARISILLLRSPPHRKVIPYALRSLARHDEPLSILVLGLHYLHNDKDSPIRREIYNRLADLAHKKTLPQAMVLYALFHSNKQQALRWLRMAMDISIPAHQPTSVEAFLPKGIPPPWLAYADIQAELGNHPEARMALDIGMAIYDAPEAFARLARYAFQDNDMNKYEEYLTKSAMAGDIGSACSLGNLYLAIYLRFSKSQTGPNYRNRKDIRWKYSREEFRMMAQEWYEIAVHDGHGPAALALAGLYRREGRDLSEATRYLDVADQDPATKDRAYWLREAWSDRDWRVDILNDFIKNDSQKL